MHQIYQTLLGERYKSLVLKGITSTKNINSPTMPSQVRSDILKIKERGIILFEIGFEFENQFCMQIINQGF